MYIKDIYEAVLTQAECSQPRFLTFLDSTARSLIAKYGMNRVVNDGAYVKPMDMSGDYPVKDEYYNAVISNILYLVTGNPDYKTDYVAEAEYAYKTVWNRAVKGLKLLGEDYYHV